MSNDDVFFLICWLLFSGLCLFCWWCLRILCMGVMAAQAWSKQDYVPKVRSAPPLKSNSENNPIDRGLSLSPRTELYLVEEEGRKIYRKK